MNNDNACLICFEEDTDTLLTCCNKKIHGSCIKQWWNMNNINLENAICPHCQQPAILENSDENYEQVVNIIPIPSDNPKIKYLPYPPNVISDTNRIHPEIVIMPNINFNLTNDEIQLVNSNRNNTIPINMFSHEINPDENNSTSFCFNILLFLFIIILLILIILLIYN